MQRCVLFSTDPRLITQIRTWAKQMEKTIRLDVFSSFDVFKEYRAGDIEGQRSEYFEKDIIDGPEGMLIRLLIVDVEMVHDDPLAGIEALQESVKELGLVSSLARPRVLLMAHEAGQAPGHLRPENFQNDAIDDLVCKPLDRQLFLQKLELMASDDPKVKPTFLFTAKTDLLVEIGKDVVVDEISEYGLAIRNPTPLNNGLFAWIHCDLLGKGGNSRVLGRVYRSTVHPLRKDESIVHFLFFGLNAEQIQNLRHFVKTRQTTLKLSNPTANRRTDKSLIAPPSRKIAIIDMNQTSLTLATEIIEGGFRNSDVQPFSSFSRLQTDLLKLVEKTEAPVQGHAPAAAAPSTPAFPRGGKIYFTVKGGGQHTLTLMEPHPGNDSIILGRKAHEWIDKPTLFFASILMEDAGLVVELIAAAEKGTKAQVGFRLFDGNRAIVFIEASGFLAKSGEGENPSLVRLELKEINQARFDELSGGGAEEKVVRDPSFYKFDAVLIDAALICPNPQEWYDGFMLLLRKTGVLGEKDYPPKIFVMGEDQPWSLPELFRVPGVHDFSYKPLDRRLALLKAQALVPDLKLQRELDTPPSVRIEETAKLAKEVKLAELSEYGLAIEQKSPFKEGILMKFFSPLFGENGGTWVTARCRYSQKTEKGDKFNSRFIFFGVSDEVFQRIRRWIREDYVAKKEGT